jgi:hypothetical protein
MQHLVDLIRGDNDHISVRATVLVGEILHMVDRLLPLQYSLRLQGMYASPAHTRNVAACAVRRSLQRIYCPQARFC